MEHLNQLMKKLGVLVVDDMDSIRCLVSSCLKELGAENILLAGNGELAWQTLTNRHVDLIICDWDMPELSGLDLLKRIRAREPYKHIPFLMLTGTTEKQHVIGAIQAGANDYLAKPFQPNELEYRIIKLLRKVQPRNPTGALG